MTQLADWQPIHGHRIDWGAFPTWVSAILTGGSLLLGFWILLGDRRRARAELANELICTLHTDHLNQSSASQTDTFVELTNTSKRYFRIIWLILVPTTRFEQLSKLETELLLQLWDGKADTWNFHWWDQYGFYVSNEKQYERWDAGAETWRKFRPTNAEIAAGERIRFEVKFPVTRQKYTPYLSFIDALNQRWDLNLLTGELHRSVLFQTRGGHDRRAKYMQAIEVARRDAVVETTPGPDANAEPPVDQNQGS